MAAAHHTSLPTITPASREPSFIQGGVGSPRPLRLASLASNRSNSNSSLLSLDSPRRVLSPIGSPTPPRTFGSPRGLPTSPRSWILRNNKRRNSVDTTTSTNSSGSRLSGNALRAIQAKAVADLGHVETEEERRRKQLELEHAKRVREFTSAAAHRDYLKVRKMIDTKININAKDQDGQTALHKCAIAGHVKLAQLLIKFGAEGDIKDQYAMTALHEAVSENSVEMIDVLISAGSDLEATSKTGWRALHYAAYWDSAEAAEKLLDEGVEANCRTKHNQTPLHLCALWNSVACANALLRHDRTNKRPADADGNTPLMLAKFHGHNDIIEAIVDGPQF